MPTSLHRGADLTACGCEAVTHADAPDTYVVEHCALHKAALALLEALEKCAPSGCVYDDPRLGPKPAECHCAGCDARAAISAARVEH